MKQRISFIALAIGLCYFYPHHVYGQRKLIVPASNSGSFKRQSNEKTAIVKYIEGKSITGSVNVFQFDQAILQDSIFFLDVFPGNSLNVIKDEIDKRSESDFSLYAHIRGATSKEGSLVLIYLNGELSGNLNYKFKNYAIHPLGKGKFGMYEIDFKQFPGDDAPVKNNNYRNNSDTFNSESLQKKSLAVSAPICPIRLLVAFTPNAENNIKNTLGYSSMIQFIHQAIAETNQAYMNSHVNFRVELASSVRVPYIESGDYDTDLSRFRNGGDGFMDEVHTYRDLYSADVCVLIFNNSAFCGLASEIQASASTAFCVVHYDCVLGNYSFGHEIGHLFGCRHNPEEDNRSSPFSYGHGFVNQAGNWRTIMAYNIHAETRLQYFSNPDVTYSGVAMGTSDLNNNARVLNETVGTVGAFRGAYPTLILNESGSVINDETADAASTKSVLLEPGFRVTNNSEFHAYIKNCTGATAVPDNNNYFANESMAADSKIMEDSLSIYPNPTRGMVTIAGNSGLENARILITDQLGRAAGRFNNISGKRIQLSLNHLTNGMYLINVYMQKKVIRKKLVIIK